jgi:tetratricopeptide (TPR) repeat protein
MRQLGTQLVDPYTQLLSFRAWALIELGRNDEAVRLVLQGEALPPPPGSRFAVACSNIIEICARAGNLAEARRVLARFDQALHQKPDHWLEQDRDFAKGLIALAEGRAKEAVAIFRSSLPAGTGLDQRDARRRWALARALLAAGDHDGAITELEKVSRRMIFEADAIAAFESMLLLAKEYEKLGRRDDALALYRRVAYQYRNAEPGLALNEEAKAGIRRLELAQARRRAS